MTLASSVQRRLRRPRGGGGARRAGRCRQSGSGSRRERMAAAVAGPLAAGGEEAAASVSVPGSPGLPGSRSAERALEEAVATGTLNLSNRRLKHFPRGAARSYDLSDITQAGELRWCPESGRDPRRTGTLICIAPPRVPIRPTPSPGSLECSPIGIGTEPATSPPCCRNHWTMSSRQPCTEHFWPSSGRLAPLFAYCAPVGWSRPLPAWLLQP